MNLALGALIILLLLLPALFFRLGIFMVRGYNPKKPDKTVNILVAEANQFSKDSLKKNFLHVLSKLNFSETLFFFSIIPILLHLISLLVLEALRKTVDFTLLLNLFSSQKDIIAHNQEFHGELIGFLTYVLVEIVLGYFSGWLLSLWVIRSPTLWTRLLGDNVWIRLFTGLILNEDVRKKVDAIRVDILSETKESSIIYSGILEKFDINHDTQALEYITINTATLRDLRKGFRVIEEVGNPPEITIKTTQFLEENGPFVKIPGKYFTVLGEKISNVNISYMNLVKIMDKDGNVIEKQWKVIG